MRPRVIIHSPVSIDGRLDGFDADLGVYYGLIARWHEDATLVGAGTVLRATQNEPVDEAPGGAADNVQARDPRPLLLVPDSRGRVRTWQSMRRAGYWRDCVALVSHQTPAKYLEYLRWQHVQVLVRGVDHVDIEAALEELSDRFGIHTVRVDSGGTLIGVLLRAGLVDEISLLIHPVIVGGTSHGALFADNTIKTQLYSVQQVGDGLVWLRYNLPAAVTRHLHCNRRRERGWIHATESDTTGRHLACVEKTPGCRGFDSSGDTRCAADSGRLSPVSDSRPHSLRAGGLLARHAGVLTRAAGGDGR